MRNDAKDITNKTFGYLTARKPANVKNKKTYWLCECSCGQFRNIDSWSLRKGKVKSCGCRKNELNSKSSRLPDGEAQLRLAFHYYKKSANDRGLVFDLTKDQFSDLIYNKCYYCGEEPNEYMYGRKELISSKPINGVDRVDSSFGYLANNVVSCCSICNRMKWDLGHQQFLNHIEKIRTNFGLGGYVVGRSGEKMAKAWKGKA